MIRNKFPAKAIFTIDIVCLLILGTIGFAFSVWRMSDAFPAASIDISVTRNEAAKIADRYARVTGFKTFDSVSYRYFDVDDDAATFLQYELGTARANQLMRHDIPVWRWEVEIQNQHEEFDADIGLDGSLQSFERKIESGTTLPDLTHDQAKEKIVEFVSHDQRVDLNAWNLISDRQTHVPGYTEHSFTWEKDQEDFNGAHLRVTGAVCGDQLTKFNRYLHVPDAFTEKFASLRAQNRALADLSWIALTIVLLSLPCVFIWAWINHRIRVKLAIIFGLAGGAVNLLTSFNKTASLLAIASRSSFGESFSQHLLSDFGSAVAVGAGCTIFFSAIEVIYRSAHPSKVAIEKIFNGSAWNSISMAKASLLGFALFGIGTGYQVFFYIFGKHHGFYVPLQVVDPTILSSFSPAWDSISVGIQASTMEEMGFRVFVLAIVQKFTRSFWLANLVQAVVWAFGHSSYAIEPPYARGLELTIGGLFAGWMFRRYGIVPVVLGHYAFDAYLEVMPLLNSKVIIDRVTALLAVAPLLVVPAISFLMIMRQGTQPDEVTANSSLEPVKTGEDKVDAPLLEVPEYMALASRTISMLIAALLISLAMFAIPQRSISDGTVLLVDRTKAIAAARAYLAKQFDMSNRQVVAWLSDDTNINELQYVYDRLRFDRTRLMEKNVEPRLSWHVRFYKIGDPTILSASVAPDGNIFSTDLDLNETAAGARLTEAQAEQLAQNYFKQTDVGRVRAFKICSVSKTERPNRSDYRFEVEVPELHVLNSRFLMLVDVLGDHVCRYDCFWSVPEEWHTRSHGDREKNIIVFILRLIVFGLLAVNVLFWVLKTLRTNPVNKSLVLLAVSVAAVVAVLNAVNAGIYEIFSDYTPTEPLNTYLVQYGLHEMSGVVTDGLLLSALAVLWFACSRKYLPQMPLRVLASQYRQFLTNRRFWSDSLLVGFVAAAAYSAVHHVGNCCLSFLSPDVPIYHFERICWLEQFSPVSASILNGIRCGFFVAIGICAVRSWNQFYEAQPGQVIVLGAILVCLTYASDDHPVNFVVNVIATVSGIAIAYLLGVRIARPNFAACIFAGLFMSVGSDLVRLIQVSPAYNGLDIGILSCILFAPLLWLASLGLASAVARKRKA